MENLILSRLMRELEPLLVGAVVEQVLGVPPLGLLFSLRPREEVGFREEIPRQPAPGSRYLLICLDPRLPGLVSLDSPPSQDAVPAETLPEGFVRSVSGFLRGATVARVRQHDSDRVAEVVFEPTGAPRSALWLELFGRRPNAVLVENTTGNILACSREGVASAAGVLLRPGNTYEPPTQREKVTVEELTTDAIDRLAKEVTGSAQGGGAAEAAEGPSGEMARGPGGVRADTHGPDALARALSGRIKGLSPSLAREVIRAVSADGRPQRQAGARRHSPSHEAAVPGDDGTARPDSLGLLNALRRVMSSSSEPRGGVRFAVELTGPSRSLPALKPFLAGAPSAVELTEPAHITLFDTAGDAVRFALSALERHLRMTAAARLRGRTRVLADKHGRLLASLNEDAALAKNSGEHRRTGELILASVRSVRRGQNMVELKDIHTDGASIVRVELDPALSPAENAQKYFRKAKKGERAVAVLARRISAAGRVKRMIEEFEHAIPEELDMRGVQALSLELDGLSKKATGRTKQRARGDAILGAPRETAPGKRGDTAPGTRGRTSERTRPGEVPSGGAHQLHKAASRGGEGGFHPRVYETSDGFTILVGRNNKENDYVTHRLAKQEDLWFHASGVAGSHVILRKKGKATPSRRAIEEAASVAAYFSKGRTSSAVPVIYTERKYVHRPRGARPGTATCARERFLMAKPIKPRSDTADQCPAPEERPQEA
ncbi:MAG: NFACT RNA binding domain-containing protein [Candidatus Eisenbacteria bacterium]